MGKNPVLAIILIIIVVAIIYYYVGINKATEVAVETKNLITQKFTDASGHVIGSISIAPPQTGPIPDYSDPTLHQIQPTAISQVTNTNVNNTNSTNSTVSKPKTSALLTFNQAVSCSPGTYQPTFLVNGIAATHLGQCMNIAGVINIYDAASLNSTTPKLVQAPYAYVLTISCNFRDDCRIDSGKDFSTKGFTGPDGSFQYLWPTSTDRTSLGIYNAQIQAYSNEVDAQGRYYEMTSSYQFILVQ